MIPAAVDKPANILTADNRRQSADKKTFFAQAPSRLRSKQPARAKAPCLSGRRAELFALRLLLLPPRVHWVEALCEARSRRQKFCVRPRLSSEQSERAVH
jgi:hypothetical protein